MNPQETEAHLHRLIERLWNQRELAAAHELCRKQVVMHFPEWQHLIGISAYQAYVTHVLTFFPDLKVHIQEMVIEGEHAAIRYSWVGTFAGGQTEMGEGRAGAAVAMQGMAIYHLVESQIAVGWSLEDWLSMYQQLGLVPERARQAA